MDEKMLKIKEFLKLHEVKIVTFLGIIVISAASFELGLVYSRRWQCEPIVVQKAVECQNKAPESVSNNQDHGTQNLTTEAKNPIINKTQPSGSSVGNMANCAYVGSKNSNKFYPPTCSYAKRIKPENVVCFATAQEAIAQGRTESTGCK